MKHAGYCALILACASSAHAAELSGTLRATGELHVANDTGVLAPASRRLGSSDDLMMSDFEVRGAAGPVSGIVTLQHVAAEHRGAAASAMLNELHASTDLAGWYLSVGKRIVSWDVGYAFRPLDVIQQEDRRRLVPTTLEGIPVLMAERFRDDAAWSVVVANPGASREELGRDEPAVAARAYWRIGAADWHAVARHGRRTGSRVGGALALVVGESVELHASVLYAQHLERIVDVAAPLERAAYEANVGDDGWQALAGVSWTSRSKASLLLEIWHDGRAWSEGQWREWQDKARHLSEAAVVPALREGAIAMQARALGVTSLHRDNVLARIAWSGDPFYPSADVLYTPADGGAIATVRLEWRGERTVIEAGWRHCFGPADSMARQLPFSDVAFLSASVSL